MQRIVSERRRYKEETKMQKQEIIFSIISTILGSSVLNGIVTHILYNNKLKKELKYKGNDMIAQDIANSLQAF